MELVFLSGKFQLGSLSHVTTMSSERMARTVQGKWLYVWPRIKCHDHLVNLVMVAPGVEPAKPAQQSEDNQVIRINPGLLYWLHDQRGFASEWISERRKTITLFNCGALESCRDWKFATRCTSQHTVWRRSQKVHKSGKTKLIFYTF